MPNTGAASCTRLGETKFVRCRPHSYAVVVAGPFSSAKHGKQECRELEDKRVAIDPGFPPYQPAASFFSCGLLFVIWPLSQFISLFSYLHESELLVRRSM